MTKTATTVPEQLARCVALGEEIAAIRADGAGRRFTRARWLELALELAGVETVEQLEALRSRVEDHPYLRRLIGVTARQFVEVGADRPAPERAFADAEREGVAYMERLACGLSIERASALVALEAARLADAERPHFWGTSTRGPGDEQAARLGEIEAELRALDAALCRDVRLADLVDGGAGLNVAGRGTVALGVERLGTAAAEMVADQRLARLAA